MSTLPRHTRNASGTVDEALHVELCQHLLDRSSAGGLRNEADAMLQDAPEEAATAASLCALHVELCQQWLVQSSAEGAHGAEADDQEALEEAGSRKL